MSKFDYARISKIALAQIERFGQVITITARSSGSYNAGTSSATVTETSQSGKALVDSYSIKEIDGNLIQVGDVKLILSALGISEPKPGFFATLENGVKYVIKNVDIISPSGVAVIYTCQLRK